MSQGEAKARTRSWVEGVALVAIVILLLLALLYVGLSSANKSKAYQAADLLIEQVDGIMETNDERTQALIGSLKEDYITRAKAIAFLLEREPAAAESIDELSEVAKLMLVDEIHLFDTTGTIVGGTVPQYYGYSFESGEQMAFFTPMLDDKDLALCQDVTPNTAEGKAMMYALCWNQSGTGMVQVGIEPVRLLKELRAVSIPEVVANIASHKGTEIFVADAESGVIEGSTIDSYVGRTLADLGIDAKDLSTVRHDTVTIDGSRAYCSAQLNNGRVTVVSQDVATANEGATSTMLFATLYLTGTALVIALIVRRMTAALLEEQRNANVDQLTGLLNRRAYELAVHEYDEAPLADDLVYLSMDLNGLKVANDTKGHEEGDKLIRCASDCMQRCLGEHGRVFRIGGDEFAALISARDDDELQTILRTFRIAMEDASREEGIELSVSTGSVMASEFPGTSLAELAKVADQRMYESKRRYYEMSGHDRRARRR